MGGLLIPGQVYPFASFDSHPHVRVLRPFYLYPHVASEHETLKRRPQAEVFKISYQDLSFALEKANERVYKRLSPFSTPLSMYSDMYIFIGKISKVSIDTHQI